MPRRWVAAGRMPPAAGPTVQHQDPEGHTQQLDGGVDALAADRQLVGVLHRLPPEGRRPVHRQHLAVGVCNERGGLTSAGPARLQLG